MPNFVGHVVLVAVTVAYNCRPIPCRVSSASSRALIATVKPINNQLSQAYRMTKIGIVIQLLQLNSCFKDSHLSQTSLRCTLVSARSPRIGSIKATSCEITSSCVSAACILFNAKRNTVRQRQSQIAVQRLVSSALRRAVPP